MKNFIVGIIVGLVAGITAYSFLSKKIEEKSFTIGYDKGTSEGIIKGIDQGKSEQKKYCDSLSTIARKPVEISTKKNRPQPQKRVDENDKNFRMYGNQVGEEIKK